MLLSFDTKSLRDICEDEKKAKAELGENVAGHLKRRVADLQAAPLIKDLLVGNPHVVPETKGKEIAIDLGGDTQMVISANHPKNPLTPDNNIDWNKVSRVKIMRIKTIHG